MLRYETLTQRAIGACVCKWNMSHSASVNHSDSPVTLLYNACHVTRDAPFLIKTLNILFCFFTDFQLDQLVIDSAMEKREMEHKHATIQQRVSSYICFSQIDRIKTVWFDGTKCLNTGCRKLNKKFAKKFGLLASLDHFQLLLLRSYFCVSVSVQTFFCLPSHTPDTTLNLRAPSCLSVADISL